MKREWRRGEPVPEVYSGMPVTFAWNEVALSNLLEALQKHYSAGYASMLDHVEQAMRDFTPPKPEEPTGLGAVVEDDKGDRWVRVGGNLDGIPRPWAEHGNIADLRDWVRYADIAAVAVLSEGVRDA